MDHIELAYEPLRTDEQGSMDNRNYLLYLTQPSMIKIAEELAVSPLEERMKNDGRLKFEFSTFSVTASRQNRSTTSWERTHKNLAGFLRVRIQDSRKFETDDFKKFEGIGYCISVDSLMSEISGAIKKNTSESEYVQLYWPKRKKDEFVRDVIIPETDLTQITEENARICAAAKKFISSLEEEVYKAFKSANKLWMGRETGYSEEDIPSKEISPLRRTRKIDRGKYIYIVHSREEVPKYKDIVDSLISDLSKIRDGESAAGYRYTREDKRAFVNLTSVENKISLERIRGDTELFNRFIKVESRYEISP